MKRASFSIVLLFILIVTTNALAQEDEIMPETQVSVKGLYLGGQASTNGWGFDLKYIFNKTITLKTGFETLAISHHFNFDEHEIMFDADLDYNTGGVFLLADINYTRNLYLSVGAALNSLNPNITGQAANDLTYGDITLPASEVGEFGVKLTPENKISPYAGLGFRSFWGEKKRVTFYFVGGFYYLGSPTVEIEATGLIAPTADPANGRKELIENQISQYKFYPVLKMSFAIKLF
jgi:hypothetical protein